MTTVDQILEEAKHLLPEYHVAILAQEVEKLRAQVQLMVVPDDAYTWMAAHGADGILVCGEKASGEAFRAKFQVVSAGELEALREIVRLLDEKRQWYDRHPRGAGGQRMPDEIDDLLCRLYEMGAHPSLRAAKGGA